MVTWPEEAQWIQGGTNETLKVRGVIVRGAKVSLLPHKAIWRVTLQGDWEEPVSGVILKSREALLQVGRSGHSRAHGVALSVDKLMWSVPKVND